MSDCHYVHNRGRRRVPTALIIRVFLLLLLLLYFFFIYLLTISNDPHLCVQRVENQNDNAVDIACVRCSMFSDLIGVGISKTDYACTIVHSILYIISHACVLQQTVLDVGSTLLFIHIYHVQTRLNNKINNNSPTRYYNMGVVYRRLWKIYKYVR